MRGMLMTFDVPSRAMAPSIIYLPEHPGMVDDAEGEEEEAEQEVPAQDREEPPAGEEDGGGLHQEGVGEGDGVSLDQGVEEEADVEDVVDPAGEHAELGPVLQEAQRHVHDEVGQEDRQHRLGKGVALQEFGGVPRGGLQGDAEGVGHADGRGEGGDEEGEEPFFEGLGFGVCVVLGWLSGVSMWARKRRPAGFECFGPRAYILIDRKLHAPRIPILHYNAPGLALLRERQRVLAHVDEVGAHEAVPQEEHSGGARGDAPADPPVNDLAGLGREHPQSRQHDGLSDREDGPPYLMYCITSFGSLGLGPRRFDEAGCCSQTPPVPPATAPVDLSSRSGAGQWDGWTESAACRSIEAPWWGACVSKRPSGTCTSADSARALDAHASQVKGAGIKLLAVVLHCPHSLSLLPAFSID